MAAPPISNQKIMLSVAALERFDYNVSHAAESLGIPRATFQNHIKRARERGLIGEMPRPELLVSRPESEEESLEDLIQRKKSRMARALEQDAGDRFHLAQRSSGSRATMPTCSRSRRGPRCW